MADLYRRDLIVEERAGYTRALMLNLHARGRSISMSLRQITLEMRNTVLVTVDLLVVKRLELRADDLEEVLEHVLLLDGLQRAVRLASFLQERSGTYPALSPIEWVRLDAQAVLQLLPQPRVARVVLVVALERQVVDLVREVVPVAVRAEVRHELVQVVRARAERAAGREVDVADDLVHAHLTRDVAALARLVAQLVCPAFLDTLYAA